jgi:hypothetical protein
MLASMFNILSGGSMVAVNIENLKHEHIYGSIHGDGRKSLRSFNNLIKEF